MAGASIRVGVLLGFMTVCGCSGKVFLAEGTSAEKRTGAPWVEPSGVGKIDFLFVIDNSPSMADKQRILALAIPELIGRFANPVCVDRTFGKQVGTAPPGELCELVYPGSVRETDPIEDIHIGVITSSLGSHGADSCALTPTGGWPRDVDDGARLIGRGEDDGGKSVLVETYEGRGFLNWDPGQRAMPPGEDRFDQLTTDFANLVRGAGQHGCEFEASLEAWYRFLVEPAPHQRMMPAPCFEGDQQLSCRRPEGVDEILLAQRRDFLRPDSLLAIVMLTDENDCSLAYGPQSYLALQSYEGTSPFHMAHGTSACTTDPWNPDCKSCWEVDAEAYPECAVGWANASADDPLSLRCFEQKRRFGIDFLHPVRRYIDALTDTHLDDGTVNPLFCQLYTDDTHTECAEVMRDRSLIFLAGIVGVPWQDIAIDPKDLTKGYRPTDQLTWTPYDFDSQSMTSPRGLPEGKTLWDMILGPVDEVLGTDVDNNGLISADEKNPRYGSILPTQEPLDPLMRESVDPREGENPATGYRLIQPEELSPMGNPINATERTIAKRDDLQYACVFELGDLGPVDCSDGSSECDCVASPENPLCWDAAHEAYGSLQYRAKGYPSRRPLAVLKGLASQGIVASVCPANLHDSTSSDYGYRPAIAAIVDRLLPMMNVSMCMGTELTIQPDGSVDCEVVEATRGDQNEAGEVQCAPCEGLRSKVASDFRKSIESDPAYRENKLDCLCALRQTPAGPELDACVGQLEATGVDGWCYIDPSQRASHNPELVAKCPAGRKRTIRYVGAMPAALSLVFLRCRGASF